MIYHDVRVQSLSIISQHARNVSAVSFCAYTGFLELAAFCPHLCVIFFPACIAPAHVFVSSASLPALPPPLSPPLPLQHLHMSFADHRPVSQQLWLSCCYCFSMLLASQLHQTKVSCCVRIHLHPVCKPVQHTSYHRMAGLQIHLTGSELHLTGSMLHFKRSTLVYINCQVCVKVYLCLQARMSDESQRLRLSGTKWS